MAAVLERAPTPLVGLLAALHVSLLAALVWMALVPEPVGASVGLVGYGFDGLVVLLPPTTFAVVGLLLALRVTRNPIGWTLFLFGLNFAATTFTESYVVLSSSRPRAPLPLAEVAAWFQSWNWAVGLLLLATALLHFPNGDLPSPAWKWLRRVVELLAATIVVAWADVWSARFDPTLIVDTSAYPGTARALHSVAGPGAMLLVAVALVSLIVRYRRAGALERLQLRWLSFAVTLAVSGIMGFLLTGSPGRGAPLVVELGALAGLASIPVSIGVAVLRYRLYDLNRLVSRTLAYALVTAVLAAVYALGVLGVEALVPTDSSDLVVAGSTLAVAALFRPVRARAQALVDRRFDRARYDAQTEVRRFATRLRHEVDLDNLVTGIEDTVRTTLAPCSVSVSIVAPGPRTSG